MCLHNVAWQAYSLPCRLATINSHWKLSPAWNWKEEEGRKEKEEKEKPWRKGNSMHVAAATHCTRMAWHSWKIMAGTGQKTSSLSLSSQCLWSHHVACSWINLEEKNKKNWTDIFIHHLVLPGWHACTAYSTLFKKEKQTARQKQAKGKATMKNKM